MAEWLDLQFSARVMTEQMPDEFYHLLQPGKGGTELAHCLKLIEPYLDRYDYVIGQYISAFLWCAVFRVAGDQTPFAILPHFNPVSLADLYSVLLASSLRLPNDIVFAGSTATSQSFQKLGFVSDPLFPLGIDLDLFRTLPTNAASLRASLGMSAKRDVLLYAGRVQRDKNVLELLELFELVRSVREAELVICFKFSTPDYLQQCLERATSIGNIRFVQNPRPDVLVQYYNAADLFVSAAVSIYETFGRAPVEAMACSTCPVVADYNGFRDTIVPGGGVLVPVAHSGYKKLPDVRQFAHSVLALLEDKTILGDNSRRCLERAQLFGRRLSLERMLVILEALLSQGAPAKSTRQDLPFSEDFPGIRALQSLLEAKSGEDLLARFVRTGEVPVRASPSVERDIYNLWFSHY